MRISYVQPHYMENSNVKKQSICAKQLIFSSESDKMSGYVMKFCKKFPNIKLHYWALIGYGIIIWATGHKRQCKKAVALIKAKS